MGKEVIRVVAAVIEHEGRYLITQRNANAVLPGLWEFPGGRVEPNEPEATALHFSASDTKVRSMRRPRLRRKPAAR